MNSSSSTSANANVRANLGVSASIWNRCKQFTNDPNRSDDEYDKCAAETKAEVEARAKAKIEAKSNFGQLMKEVRTDMKEEMKDARVKVKVEDTRNLLMRWKNHFLGRLSRMINQAGMLAKRICNAQNSDQTLAKQCLANLKTEFKAKVDAAIEASFSY